MLHKSLITEMTGAVVKLVNDEGVPNAIVRFTLLPVVAQDVDMTIKVVLGGMINAGLLREEGGMLYPGEGFAEIKAEYEKAEQEAQQHSDADAVEDFLRSLN